MIVVADTSPFVVLVAIGQVDILPTLFQEVLIPPQVASELASSRLLDERVALFLQRKQAQQRSPS
jgi:predicted nucleic acid-binding protein